MQEKLVLISVHETQMREAFWVIWDSLQTVSLDNTMRVDSLFIEGCIGKKMTVWVLKEYVL